MALVWRSGYVADASGSLNSLLLRALGSILSEVENFRTQFQTKVREQGYGGKFPGRSNPVRSLRTLRPPFM